MQKSLEVVFGKTGMDERSLKFLLGAIRKNDHNGFDYLEFKESLHNLERLNLDKEVAVSHAYATATTIGVTKERLLESAKHYKSLIAKERKRFDQAFENQVNAKIEHKKKEIEQLKSQLIKYESELASLTQKIDQTKTTISSANKIIESEQDKINATKFSFDNTYYNLFEDIDKDIELIEKNL